MGTGKNDPFEKIRLRIRKAILAEYQSIENFCLANDLNKSTVYRFLRGEVAEVMTLSEIAKALGGTLEIRLKFD